MIRDQHEFEALIDPSLRAEQARMNDQWDALRTRNRDLIHAFFKRINKWYPDLAVVYGGYTRPDCIKTLNPDIYFRNRNSENRYDRTEFDIIDYHFIDDQDTETRMIIYDGDEQYNEERTPRNQPRVEKCQRVYSQIASRLTEIEQWIYNTLLPILEEKVRQDIEATKERITTFYEPIKSLD